MTVRINRDKANMWDLKTYKGIDAQANTKKHCYSRPSFATRGGLPPRNSSGVTPVVRLAHWLALDPEGLYPCRSGTNKGTGTVNFLHHSCLLHRYWQQILQDFYLASLGVIEVRETLPELRVLF